MLRLPDNFQHFDEERKEGFLEVYEYKKQGKKVVGIYCSYTPWELIYAAGAIPVSLCGGGSDTITFAETKLPSNLCPMVKSSFGAAASDNCPYFYFSDMVLAETTCDGKKKMYEMLGKLKPVHIMQLPPGRDSNMSLQFWYNEMVRAKEVIEETLGTTITEENLKAAIKLKNRERKAVLDFYKLGMLNPTPLSGYEMSTMVDATEYCFDIEENIKTLQQRTIKAKEEYETIYESKPKKPRILITGCPIGGVRDKIVARVEEMGADVVGLESCSGPREKKDLVDETKDPLWALAEKYLRVSCSVMSPNDERFEALDDFIHNYDVDGVIEVILHACHTFAIEADMVKDYVMNEKNLPYICITTDYSETDSGQIDTRLEAFIEMIG